MIKSQVRDYNIVVIITHFVPPQIKVTSLVRDYLLGRLKFEYLRSWARLIKHGTRGNQPWKRDIMTRARRENSKYREDYLAQVIKSLEEIECKSLHIHVFSNQLIDFPVIKKSTKFQCHVYKKYSKMNQLNNSPWSENEQNSPWYLLWEHKDLLRSLGETEDSETLYIVTENDFLITQKNIDYWLRNRIALRKSQLIPSFILIEYSKNRRNWFCPSIHDFNDRSKEKWSLISISNKTFAHIPSLYAGMFIFDWELISEYINSEAIDPVKSKSLTWWDLGARAAMGLQFHEPPMGLTDRYVIGLNGGGDGFEMGALLHHLPNLYVSVPEVSSKFPTINQILDKVQLAPMHSLSHRDNLSVLSHDRNKFTPNS